MAKIVKIKNKCAETVVGFAFFFTGNNTKAPTGIDSHSKLRSTENLLHYYTCMMV